MRIGVVTERVGAVGRPRARRGGSLPLPRTVSFPLLFCVGNMSIYMLIPHAHCRHQGGGGPTASEAGAGRGG